MPNLVEILVTAKNLTGPAFAEVKASGEGMSSTMDKVNKVSALAATAMVGFLGESVRMASKFDSEMTLLHTQAGVSQDKIAGLSRGVLDLAGQVGFSPDSLAESLFHVESNFESMGITSQKALETTRIAAEGAAVGHAKLVDVTNALTAAVASGIPGVQDMQQAMGVLNATVGVGDMKMQDLANAFGSGMVATVKGFGLNIADVGAALAVFGDNNIRGSLAGNQLRMSVMALAMPVKSAASYLKEFGMTSHTLADDMQRGGLKLALEDLQAHFQKAGITATQQGQVITEMFGRKAGAGLNVLMDQMDRLESKYPALAAGAHGFGDAWAATQKTFAQQTKELQGSLDALMITLGEKLIPYVQDVVKALLDHKGAVVGVAEAVGGLIAVMAGFSAVNKTLTLVQNLGQAFTDAAAAMLAYKGRVVEAQVASDISNGSVARLGAAFTALGTKAKLAVAATGVGLFIVAAMTLADMSKQAPPDIDRMTTSLTNLGRSGAVAGELAKTFGLDLEKLGNAADLVGHKASGLDSFMEGAYKLLTLGSDKSKTGKAVDQINAIDDSLANLVKAGHADLAAAALQRLQNQMQMQGKDPDKLAAELGKYHDALGTVALQQSLTADSMGALGQQAVDTTAALAGQAKTADGLKQAIIALNDVNRSALDGMAGFYAAIDAASKSLETDGANLKMVKGQLDLTTDGARKNEKALSDLAAKTDKAAEAALNNGQSIDQVNQIYATGRQKLIAYAEQMGLNTDAALRLADQILQTPDKTAQLKADESDLKAKIADMENSLRNATGEKKVQLLADKTQLESDLQDVQNALNSLPSSKTVTVFINPKMGQSSMTAGMAHGGIVGAAGGGPRSGMTWVGEQGPELVRLPSGSTVYPAGQSRGMAAAAAGGGGGPQKVQLEWVGGNAGDDFMAWLRKNIRIKGGNVQNVLGQ